LIQQTVVSCLSFEPPPGAQTVLRNHAADMFRIEPDIADEVRFESFHTAEEVPM
jgi:hypothetical protein